MIEEDLAKDQWFFNLHMKNTFNYRPETKTKQINIEERQVNVKCSVKVGILQF